MRRAVLISILLFPAVRGAAQYPVDSLRGVEVRDAGLRQGDAKSGFRPGQAVYGIDSGLRQHFEQQQLATLITMATPVFVRSYGVNSLATLSFRGASSAQSAVLWEGIPLMNAATGIADISLLPVAFSDSISIRYGGNGALDGSGNVGGALLLQSRAPRFSRHTEAHGSAQVTIGSFGQLSYGGAAELRSSRLQLRLKLQRQLADNDFHAVDQQGHAYVTEHAGMQGAGGTAELALRLSSRDQLRFHAWLQQYRREIPAALFERLSDKRQDDASGRYLVQYTHEGRIFRHYLKAAWMKDGFRYQMPSAGINTDIATGQLVAEAGTERGFGKWGRLLVFMPAQLSQLRSKDTTASQQRVALAAAWRKTLLGARLHTALNIRAEQIDDDAFILPGGSLSWDLGPAWTLRGSIQRSYRAPTLNERYYVPGGNPLLKPEQGWSGEGGYRFRRILSGKLSLEHSATVFTRLIDNWIIWLGGAIWTPHNLSQVWSRGVETENRLEGPAGGLHWNTAVSFAWTRSTPTRTVLPNDNSIGKQIPYTPSLTGNLRLGLSWKTLRLTYLHTYSGLRYITSDESSSLKAFHTADLIASAGILRKPRLQVQLSLRNMYDVQYAVIAYRPMPGRSFQAGLQVDL